jgi:cytochrome c5
MKKLFVLIFMVALGSFLLSSCGGNTQKSEKSKVTATKTKTEKTYVANLENGKKVYSKVCIACHMTGVAGAPALKDKARWTEIAAKGMKQLHQHAIKGFTGKHGVMPPKGTCTDCSDQDLYDAVAYMLKTAGVKAK